MVKRSVGLKRGRGRPRIHAEPQKRGTKHVNCKGCGSDMVIDINFDAGTCSNCVSKLVGMPEPRGATTKYVPKTEAAGKGWGRGWWFKKKFVAPDGSVWKRGVKVSD